MIYEKCSVDLLNLTDTEGKMEAMSYEHTYDREWI